MVPLAVRIFIRNSEERIVDFTIDWEISARFQGPLQFPQVLSLNISEKMAPQSTCCAPSAPRVLTDYFGKLLSLKTLEELSFLIMGLQYPLRPARLRVVRCVFRVVLASVVVASSLRAQARWPERFFRHRGFLPSVAFLPFPIGRISALT